MARIALLSWGSHGDIAPFVALALGLRAAGHEVVLGAQPYHGEFVIRHGIAFCPLGCETSVARYTQLMDVLVSEPNPRKQMRCLLQELLLPDLEAQLQDALPVVADADLVVAHWMQLSGMLAAELLHRPCVTVSLNPLGLQVVADAPESVGSAGSARNLGKMLSDYIWGDAFHHLRARHDLPTLDSVADYQYSKHLNLVAMSRHLLADTENFAPQHRVTGFWSLPDDATWQPAAELENFLAAPEKPVVVSFGSMGGRAAETSRMVIEAVHRLGCRAILQGGWAGLSVPDLTCAQGRILTVGYVPHEVLFRHAACVVHHGGAGTTAAALRAGVPSVVVWHMLDQPDWGHRLAALGLGATPLARQGLCVEALANRLSAVLTQPEYATRCREMAQRLAAEQGVAQAVREIEAFCNVLAAPQSAKL